LFQVHRSIVVAIVASLTVSAHPRSVIQGEAVIDLPADRTGFGRGEETVSFGHRPACPGHFVANELDKLGPTRIRDRFGQMVVFEHPGNVQVLKDHAPKPIGDLAAQLVMELLAAVGDSLMLPGKDGPCAGATFRAFGFSAESALANLESSFGLPQVPGRGDLLPGREHGEVFQPQVNADPIGEGGPIRDG